MTLWVGARDLFNALRDYRGERAYEELITPWLAEDGDAYRAQLEPLNTYSQLASSLERSERWSMDLYALSRISDVLLLSFQPDADHSMPTPWAHLLHLADTRWPAVSREQYADLFGSLGMRVVTEAGFDPSLHEIVEVDQVDDPDTPIAVTEMVWPGLMLGQMVFARAGVKVRAGSDHAQRGFADRSPLYWTFLRRHRPTVDLSHGWGHNSQWDTEFRRDYRTDNADYLNVDATGDIDANDPSDGDLTPLLTSAERRDLVRHRCLLRAPENRTALEATDDHWPVNLWPFYWRLKVEPPVDA